MQRKASRPRGKERGQAPYILKKRSAKGLAQGQGRRRVRKRPKRFAEKVEKTGKENQKKHFSCSEGGGGDLDPDKKGKELKSD